MSGSGGGGGSAGGDSSDSGTSDAATAAGITAANAAAANAANATGYAAAQGGYGGVNMGGPNSGTVGYNAMGSPQGPAPGTESVGYAAPTGYGDVTGMSVAGVNAPGTAYGGGQSYGGSSRGGAASYGGGQGGGSTGYGGAPGGAAGAATGGGGGTASGGSASPSPAEHNAALQALFNMQHSSAQSYPGIDNLLGHAGNIGLSGLAGLDQATRTGLINAMAESGMFGSKGIGSDANVGVSPQAIQALQQQLGLSSGPGGIGSDAPRGAPPDAITALKNLLSQGQGTNVGGLSVGPGGIGSDATHNAVSADSQAPSQQNIQALQQQLQALIGKEGAPAAEQTANQAENQAYAQTISPGASPAVAMQALQALQSNPAVAYSLTNQAVNAARAVQQAQGGQPRVQG